MRSDEAIIERNRENQAIPDRSHSAAEKRITYIALANARAQSYSREKLIKNRRRLQETNYTFIPLRLHRINKQ